MFFDVRSLHSFVAVISARGLVGRQVWVFVSG